MDITLDDNFDDSGRTLDVDYRAIKRVHHRWNEFTSSPFMRL